MKNIIADSLFLLGLTSSICNQSFKKETTNHSDWIKLSLPNGWILQAPKGFRAKTLQGIDSEPGVINSKQDSIYLQFDSGTEMMKKRDCSFTNNIEKAKESIEKGFYKTFYKIPSEHIAYVDTIDNKVAIIVRPTMSGHGTVAINISDCKTGEWLGITGTDLTLVKENIVLDIFKTIKLPKKEE